MKFYRLFFILICFLIYTSCTSQQSNFQIEIVPVTIQQETTSIWRTIQDIDFFEKHGYSIHLPKDKLIDSLIIKSKNGTFGNEDFGSIYHLLETKIFNSKDYVQAFQKVTEQRKLLHTFIKKIEVQKRDWDWKFQTFDTYKIMFTLYGTGGSYDPDEGTVTLLTTPEGHFMKYQNPTYTIIHEITHIGMEYSIVQKHQLSHGNKERIVDTFVYSMFKEFLPGYQIQNMGDSKIDTYLRDIKSLDASLSIFFHK